MNIVQRMQAPTPKFFRILRSVGIVLAAAGGSILAAPVALPAMVLTIAGYATVAGSVMTAVSQAAVEDERQQKAKKSEE
jgi:hypothetical protein